MQQILGNTTRLIKGHDITSLTFNKYMLVIFPESKFSFKYEKHYFMCEKREIANQISFVVLLKKQCFKYYRFMGNMNHKLSAVFHSGRETCARRC
jgi:hypothetical protein